MQRGNVIGGHALNLTMRYGLILFLLLSLACSKDRSCESCEERPGPPDPAPAIQQFNAVIFDAGAQAADGCGWMIKIDTKFYHPQSLEPAFQENNLPVVLSFEPLKDSFYCGFAPIGRPSIKILSIRRQ